MPVQDFSSELVTVTPNTDILSYYPDRQLYWLCGPGKPPFCNKPEQPLNQQLLASSIRRSEAHCNLFDMSKEQDKQLFQLIKNRVLQGWYRVAKEENNWDAENRKMLIWLEWIQDYLMYPLYLDSEIRYDK